MCFDGWSILQWKWKGFGPLHVALKWVRTKIVVSKRTFFLMSHFADVFAFAGCVEHLLDSRIKTFLNFPEGCLRIYVMAWVDSASTFHQNNKKWLNSCLFRLLNRKCQFVILFAQILWLFCQWRILQQL